MPDRDRWWRRSVGQRGGTCTIGRRVVVVALVVATAWLVAALPAWGHAAFVSSQPEPGADLASAPGVVRLRFTEPMIAELSSVKVTDPLGQTFRGGLSGETAMEVEVDSTARGTYVVEWKTVSPIDGHTLTGRYTFGVGSDVGEQAAPSDAPGPGDLAVAALRTVEYAGLLGALGLLALSALADSGKVGWRPRGVHRWILVAAAGGLVTVAGEVVLAASGSVADAARGFLGTSTGRVRLVRLVIEVIAVVVAVVAARRAGTGRVEPRPVRAATVLLLLAALAAVAAAGHAAASSYGTWIATGHLWTAALWAGTVLAMAVHHPPGGWRGEVGRQLAREFTPIALAAFTATAVLGLARGVQELGHVSDLWATPYGQVLWAKLFLVVVMAGLSTLVWRRARHHPRGEGVAAAGVVLLAAVLVAFPVPPGRAGDDPAAETAADTNGLPQPGDLTLARTADETVVGLSIRPGEPGVNDLFVHLVPRGGEGAEEIEVSLVVDDGRPADTRRCGDACRVATAPLEEGTTLAFELTGLEGATGRASFTVPPLPAPDGTSLLQAAEATMDGLDTVRYDETFGPGDPPTTSTWELVLPDRLHGTLHPPDYRETIRIGDRWWNRTDPEGPWTEATGSGEGLSVRVDEFVWELNRSNVRLAGEGRVDGVPTRIVSFFGEIGELPLWYRLWVDDDDRVRRAVMLTQGHFMDQRYYDFDAPIQVQPPD